ncbi:hypothetical protein CAEBREN_13613 [Caenorhabditis brenneri]|uniref:Uncharacterized protein n=1 Tax=Caenorhabditis brenneri TaxID=135651 RepID=G0N884_CAEBE|nr:hypothetical protein CAEBREN_13613 [Caenorhabditis brenneri]
MNPPLPLFAARLCLIAAWMTIFEPKYKKIKRSILEIFVEFSLHSIEDKSSTKLLIDRLCDDGQEQLPVIPEIISKYLGRIHKTLDANVRIPYSFRQLNNLPEKVKNVISPDGLRKLWRTRKFTKGLIIEEMQQAYMDAVFRSVSDYFHYKPDILSSFAKSLAVVVEQNHGLMKLLSENGSYSKIEELVCSLSSCPMLMFRVMLYKVSEHIKTIMKDCAPVPESSLMNDLGALNGLRDYWAPNDLPVNPKFQQLGEKLMKVVFESYIKRFNGAPESQLDFEQHIFSTAHQDPRVKLMLKKKTNITIHKESKLPMEVHRFCHEYIAKYELVQPMVLEEIERVKRAKSEQATTSKDVGTTSSLQIEDDKSTTTDETPEVLPRRSKSSNLRIENDRSSSTTTTITTDDTTEVLPRRSRSAKKKQTQPKHPEQRKPHSPPKLINGKVLKAIRKTRLNKKRHRTPDPPYRPNREAKKEPKPQIQEVSSACDKCYRMSQWCILYKKYLGRTKVQLENCRIRANKCDDLEKQTKMMGEKMEEKDRKIAELEKYRKHSCRDSPSISCLEHHISILIGAIKKFSTSKIGQIHNVYRLLNARNDNQSAYIAQLEAQLAASQKKVLELEDSENQPTCSSFDANLQKNQKFKEMESRMKKMEEEFEKLKTRTSSPSAPDFEALQDQILEKTASLRVSEKANSILVSKNLSLKEEVGRLHREMELMREREHSKDVELKKSQRENEVLQMTIQKHEESFKDVYYRFNNEDWEKTVQTLRNQFTTSPDCYNTLNYKEATFTFESLSVDPSQKVAIVPDISLSIKKCSLQANYTILMNTFAPDGSYVMAASQALLENFLKYVVKRRKKPIPGAFKTLKIELMGNLCKYGSTFFVRSRNCTILELHPENPGLERAGMAPFVNERNDDIVTYSDYQRYCKWSDLPPYPRSWWDKTTHDMPVWLARYYLVAGLWQSFAPTRTDIMDKLLDALEDTFMEDTKCFTKNLKKLIMESDGTTSNETLLGLQEPVTPEFVRSIWMDLPKKTSTKFRTLEDECLKVVFDDVSKLFNGEDPGILMPKLVKIAKLNKEVRKFTTKTKPPLDTDSKLPVEVYDFIWIDQRKTYDLLIEKIREIIENRPRQAVLSSKIEAKSESTSMNNDQSQSSKDSLPDPEEVKDPPEDETLNKEKSEAGAQSISAADEEEYDVESRSAQKNSKDHRIKIVPHKDLAYQKTAEKPSKLSERVVKTLSRTRRIPGRFRKADPLYSHPKSKKAPQKQAESASCRKCYRMSKRLRIVRRKWKMARLLLAKFREKTENFEELLTDFWELEKQVEQKDERIANLEEWVNEVFREYFVTVSRINKNQIQKIEYLEKKLKTNESAVLYNVAVRKSIESLEASLQDKEFEIAALSTNLPTPPISPQEFIQLKAALEKESMMRAIAEKQNQVLIQQTVTLKQENEILKRESGIAKDGGAELEAMKKRENTKDLELEALRREIDVLKQERKIDGERENAKDLELEALRREIEVFKVEKKINGETIKSLLYKNSKDSESSSEHGSSSPSFRYQ